MIGTARFLCVIGAMAFCLAVTTGQSSARNVPGSAGAAIQQIYENATTDIADGIIAALNAPSGGPVIGGVSRDQWGTVTFSSFGGSIETDSGLIVGASTRLQTFDITDEIEDGTLFTGSFLLGQRLDAGPTVFAALIYEGLEANTPFNSGTVENTGLGAAFGVTADTPTGLVLSAMVGGLALDYDVTRSAGAVAGSFAAERWFVDLRAQHDAALRNTRLEYDFGLRYVEQTDDAYTETGVGAGAVPSFTYSSTATFFNMRTFLGGMDRASPYVQSNYRYVFSNDAVPPAGDPAFAEGLRFYLGLGVEGQTNDVGYDFGLGTHFTDDGYTGLAAQLSVNVQF